MMKKIKNAALAIGVLLMIGCSLSVVDIKPELSVTPQNIGKGRSMTVTFSDERIDSFVGKAVPDAGGKNRYIVEKNEAFVESVKTAIEGGFQTLGYKISKNQTKRVTNVAIELLEIRPKKNFITGMVKYNSNSKYRVVCTLPSGKKFENIYVVENIHHFWAGAGRGKMTQWINLAVSDGIMRMFNDTSFIAFLKSGR